MSRKLKMMTVAPEFMLSVAKETKPFRVIKNALPRDAKVVDTKLVDGRTLHLKITSESFPEVPEGDEIPMVEPVLFEIVER